MTQRLLDRFREQVEARVHYDVWDWLSSHTYWSIGDVVHKRHTRNGCWKYDKTMKERINA